MCHTVTDVRIDGAGFGIDPSGRQGGWFDRDSPYDVFKGALYEARALNLPVVTDDTGAATIWFHVPRPPVYVYFAEGVLRFPLPMVGKERQSPEMSWYQEFVDRGRINPFGVSLPSGCSIAHRSPNARRSPKILRADHWVYTFVLE